jgi:hypothetical protein
MQVDFLAAMPGLSATNNQQSLHWLPLFLLGQLQESAESAMVVRGSVNIHM